MKVRYDKYGEPIVDDPKLINNPNYDEWKKYQTLLVWKLYYLDEPITMEDRLNGTKILFPSDDEN